MYTNIYTTRQNVIVQSPQTYKTEQYDNDGIDWYFRFDDKKMGYKCILSIT